MIPPANAEECGRLLTLDRGNTTLDGMWHGEPAWRHRVDPQDPVAVRELLRRSVGRVVVVALSAVPGALVEVERELRGRGAEFFLAGRDLPCPLRVAYPVPAGLGVDRWVGGFAGHRLYGAVITVDCGTAVTVNVIDAAGVFLGGAIGPGAGTMVAGLHRAAPALPAAELDADLELPARSPQAAVNLGAQIGFCGAVDRLVEDLRAAAQLPHAELVLTGGDAGLYLRHGRQPARHHPDLLHLGLRWLFETHSSNS